MTPAQRGGLPAQLLQWEDQSSAAKKWILCSMEVFRPPLCTQRPDFTHHFLPTGGSTGHPRSSTKFSQLHSIPFIETVGGHCQPTGAVADTPGNVRGAGGSGRKTRGVHGLRQSSSGRLGCAVPETTPGRKGHPCSTTAQGLHHPDREEGGIAVEAYHSRRGTPALGVPN